MNKVVFINTSSEIQQQIKEFPGLAENNYQFVFESVDLKLINRLSKLNPSIIIFKISDEKNFTREWCAKLKQGANTANIPVVLLMEPGINSWTTKDILQLKCDGILTQPFGEVEFTVLLNSMLKIRENNIKKSIENDLRIERDRADNIIEGINAGTWDWNIETGEMIINSRWARMLGYTLKELQPVTIETWRKMMNPKDLRIAENKVSGHFKGKIRYYYAEFRMRHKNNNWVWINSRGKIVERSADGKPLRMVGTHIDITHKKNAEKELIKAKEKAIESDRLKSAFLSNMSHEIRTPMNGILGFIDLMKDTELNSETQHYYIDIVKKSGERLLDTINDIIELSKIEAGEVPFHTASLCIDELMHFFHVFFKPQAEKKGLDLIYISPVSNTQFIVNTDRIKLESILTNLIKNALKFTSHGSIEFGFRKKGEKLLFFVKDTGSGISKDKLEVIFERFVQANLKFNRGYEGSGLGLAIAKAYTKMLGGEIWVTSEENMGSTFQFTINYDPVSIESISNLTEPETESAVQDYSNAEILIAEDEEVNFVLMEQLLAGMKLNLIHAQNGIEAIDICQNNPNISLILMDIKMPVMDGYTAAQKIQVIRPGVPIIAQSAYALSHEIEQYNQLFDDYITKPINRAELKKKIRRFIG